MDTINKRVLKDKEIIQMSELCNIYIHVLEDEGNPNKNFRSEKLKAKLTKHGTNSKIRFVKVILGNKGFISYSFVFSASLTTEDAIARAYKLGAI